MVKVLLQFEQRQSGVGTAPNGINLSILTYHFGWKRIYPFHLKIHPNSTDEFRSLIYHYNPNKQDADKIAQALMSDTLFTEFNDFETELKFIITNINHTDVFHVDNDAGLRCNFFISRRTYCIVAMDVIHIEECEDPYHIAYHHARMLEERFGEDVVGGVNFAIDHKSMQIWVWARCDEVLFEAEVLKGHVPVITKSGEFQQYNELSQRQKSRRCNQVFIRILGYDIRENELREFFRECGEVDLIKIPKHPNGKSKNFAYVTFTNDAAVEKAVQLNNTLLKESDHIKVKVSYSRSWNYKNK